MKKTTKKEGDGDEEDEEEEEDNDDDDDDDDDEKEKRQKSLFTQYLWTVSWANLFIDDIVSQFSNNCRIKKQ
ncbi:unnamed protein product [Enterobius vermicularis]|uniref:Uncharacterized protein n=1 Tax=Enterobius vermicularis TaxID=51028 RepID=A0A0N4VNL6_ENTVE|nr:unnamed protein product [Enterobius vermicularis]